MRALAVSALERSPLLPDLPTIAETPPGFDAYAMNYVTVRAGTQRPIIERLPGMGASPTGSTPEELEQVIRSETQKWNRVIEISGAKAE